MAPNPAVPGSSKRPTGLLLLAALLVAPSAWADAPAATCEEAEALIGSAARTMSPAECDAALRAAEEDQWQLWLDLAFAEESTGNFERALETYRRFVTSTLRRGQALEAPWGGLRDEAMFTIARLEGELMKSHGRITFKTQPPNLRVRFPGDARRGEETAPVTRFLPPGEHVVAVSDPDSGRSRELSFPVEVGQMRELVVDLRPDSPVGATERVLAGDRPAAPATPEPRRDDAVRTATREADAFIIRVDDDPSPPPRGGHHTSALQRVGTAAIGIGVAATAVGIGLMLNASGLRDEARCAGDFCDVAPLARESLRSSGSVAEDRGIAGLVTGGVFLVGGAVALILDALADDEPADAAGLRLRSIHPAVGQGHAGLGATIGF